MGWPADEVRPADIDETPRAGELPAPYAARVAAAKLAACPAPGSLVLAADTVVSVGRRILPKPDSEAEAGACLRLLSGRRHVVLGALALALPDGRVRTRLVATGVAVKRLTEAELAAYLASGEWRGKAGGYAIQGRFAVFVRAIAGSYSNIVGLSLHDLAQMLDGAGFPVGAAW